MRETQLRVPVSIASRRGVSWLARTAVDRRVVLTRFGSPRAVVDSAERVDEGSARIQTATRLVVERYADAGLGHGEMVTLGDLCEKLSLDPAKVRARAEALRDVR